MDATDKIQIERAVLFLEHMQAMARHSLGELEKIGEIDHGRSTGLFPAETDEEDNANECAWNQGHSDLENLSHAQKHLADVCQAAMYGMAEKLKDVTAGHLASANEGIVASSSMRVSDDVGRVFKKFETFQTSLGTLLELVDWILKSSTDMSDVLCEALADAGTVIDAADDGREVADIVSDYQDQLLKQGTTSRG